MIVLLVGSVALVFWYESLDAQDDTATRTLLERVDLALAIVFVLEWTWRVRRSSPASGRYALRHSWELLGMVPILLPLPSFLRFLRLLRVVRILRVFGAVGRRIGVWQRIAGESKIAKIGLASGIVTLTGAVLVWLLERGEPGTHINDFSTALWWAIVTVTTVGYGDVTPLTWQGRTVAAMLMVTGIGTIGLLASSLASVLVRNDDRAASPSATAGGFVGDLQAIAALHESGKLTDDEYAAAKSRLLR